MAELKDLFVTYNPMNLGLVEDDSKLPENNRWVSFENLRNLIKANNFQSILIKEPDEEKPVEEKPVEEPNLEQLIEDTPIEIPFRLGSPDVNKFTNTHVEEIKRENKPRYSVFRKQFDKFAKENKLTTGEIEMLTSIAAVESGFKPYAKNNNSTALGYFQMLDGTREEVLPNITRDQFKNDVNLQFKAALNLLRKRLQGVIRNVTPLNIENSGLSPLLIIYGMWWRPKSVYNYINKGYDNYETKDGMTVLKVFDKMK